MQKKYLSMYYKNALFIVSSYFSLSSTWRKFLISWFGNWSLLVLFKIKMDLDLEME